MEIRRQPACLRMVGGGYTPGCGRPLVLELVMTADDLRAMLGPVPEGWTVRIKPDDQCAVVRIPLHGTEHVYAMQGAWLADSEWWPEMEADGHDLPPESDRHPTLIAALVARFQHTATEYEARARRLAAFAEMIKEGA